MGTARHHARWGQGMTTMIAGSQHNVMRNTVTVLRCLNGLVRAYAAADVHPTAISTEWRPGRSRITVLCVTLRPSAEDCYAAHAVMGFLPDHQPSRITLYNSHNSPYSLSLERERVGVISDQRRNRITLLRGRKVVSR